MVQAKVSLDRLKMHNGFQITLRKRLISRTILIISGLAVTDYISCELGAKTPEKITDQRKILVKNETLAKICVKNGLWEALTNMTPDLEKVKKNHFFVKCLKK